MKNLNTLLLATSLITASFLATSTASANVDTAGQASSLCKAEAAKVHPGYKRSKSVKIKQTRGVFKIKLKVVTESETMATFCDVTQKGEVSYTKT